MSINKTIKLIGKRTLELPYENYIKHGEVVDHWICGGAVERNAGGLEWLEMRVVPNFNLDGEYRIKQREPKPGEVWINECDGSPCLYTNSELDKAFFVGLDNMMSIYTELPIINMTYAAPNVKAYVAREMLGDKTGTKNANDCYSVYNAAVKAAMLEEE